MPNLSQIKRERMLAFLQKIKDEHRDDDDMLIALGEIESELTSKKYGLVWEQHEEAVDVMMRDNIPVFTEVPEREITAAPGRGYNFILEGDNLHSLRLLEKTHKGKIDLIYIDPPYNTGNKDFVYDDAFVDKTDLFSHSKWLSFMEKRLRIARNLLSDRGVIFISIDDNEEAPLQLLCDDIQLLLNRFAVEDESQKLHHIIIGQNRRLSQKGFQHSGTGTEPMGSLASGQPLDFAFQSLFLVLGCGQFFLSYIFLLLQFFQLLIRQSLHPLLTQTMSYPRASASSTASP